MEVARYLAGEAIRSSLNMLCWVASNPPTWYDTRQTCTSTSTILKDCLRLEDRCSRRQRLAEMKEALASLNMLCRVASNPPTWDNNNDDNNGEFRQRGWLASLKAMRGLLRGRQWRQEQEFTAWLSLVRARGAVIRLTSCEVQDLARRPTNNKPELSILCIAYSI